MNLLRRFHLSRRRLTAALILLVFGPWMLVVLARNSEGLARAEAPMQAPATPVAQFLPFIVNNTNPPNPLYRFGVDEARLPFTSYTSSDISPLRLGWYIDFGVSVPAFPRYGMEYVPTVRVKQLKVDAIGNSTLCCPGCAYQSPATYSVSPSILAIQSTAASHPGMTWIVGNEMDRIDWSDAWQGPGNCFRQDEMLPEVYAQAYHEVYTAIKSADQTAQIAFGPLVQPSDLRIMWLERAWNEYDRLYGNGQLNSMPVDVWSIHVYVYRERSCAAHPDDCWGADIPAGISVTDGALFSVADHKNFNIAAQMIVNWRTWMKNHGQQQKPLITPEYGVVFPDWVLGDNGAVLFSPAQVRDEFMYPSFNYFLDFTDTNIGYAADGYRLMQRWAWFSADYDNGQCKDGYFYQDYNSNLLYSGLLPRPPVNCAYPAQGRSPYWIYWTNYVQLLPAGVSKPYASAASLQSTRMVQAAGNPNGRGATLVEWPATSNCTDSSAAPARLLQQLPSRSTSVGRAEWLKALSASTPGARVCQP